MNGTFKIFIYLSYSYAALDVQVLKSQMLYIFTLLLKVILGVDMCKPIIFGIVSTMVVTPNSKKKKKIKQATLKQTTTTQCNGNYGDHH